jgi:hypothetical protein
MRKFDEIKDGIEADAKETMKIAGMSMPVWKWLAAGGIAVAVVAIIFNVIG